MNFSLSTEQLMLVETVRRFVETELYPHEDLVERRPELIVSLALGEGDQRLHPRSAPGVGAVRRRMMFPKTGRELS